MVNDRWGKNCRSKHGGFYTTEYGHVGWGQDLGDRHKWEECRGIGKSFGYNRNEEIDDYMTPRDLIRMLISICNGGGNLLLDIGPTADGRIPVIMEQRLLAMGTGSGTRRISTVPGRARSRTCRGAAARPRPASSICTCSTGRGMSSTCPGSRTT